MASKEEEEAQLQKCIGDSRYAVRLQNLMGTMALYNNVLVNPKITKSGYLVNVKKLERTSDAVRVVEPEEIMQLVLPAKNFRVSRAEKHHTDDDDGDTKGGTIKQLGSRIDELTAEFRTILKTLGKEEFIEKFLYHACDTDDGNDEIDKAEFMSGCEDIGVEITKKEIDMLYPLIDTNSNGTLDLQELIDFSESLGVPKASLTPKSTQRSLAQRKQLRNTVMTNCKEMTQAERQSRIQKKTHLPKIFASLIIGVRTAFRTKMEQEDLSTDDLYLLFDDDGNKTIDKTEFTEGLRMAGLDVPLILRKMMWKVLHKDEVGQMQEHTFKSFVNQQPWKLQELVDMFDDMDHTQLDEMELAELGNVTKLPNSLVFVLSDQARESYRRIAARASQGSAVPSLMASPAKRSSPRSSVGGLPSSETRRPLQPSHVATSSSRRSPRRSPRKARQAAAAS